MASVIFNNKFIFAAAVLISFGAFAESGTAWDLDNLQKQRVLYEAKAALNKAKADAESQSYGSGGVSTATGSVPVANQTLTAEIIPQLIKINGRNAVISMSDGNTTTVSTGQMLPGGRWQVISIGLGGVKIKNLSTQRTQVIN